MTDQTDTASATLYDGATSGAWPVMLTRDGDTLRLSGLAEPRSYALRDVRLEPRLGSQPRRLALPDGGVCESDDHAGIEAIFGKQDGILYQMESRWRWVGYSILFVAGFALAFYLWGLPLLGRAATAMTPPVVEHTLGKQVIGQLHESGHWLQPSTLPAARQAGLRRRFAQLIPADSRYRYELYFHAAPQIGANAFALPGGVVVVTDELVAIADDDEVTAVLAHEIGHVELRHGLRMVYQSAGIGIAIAAILGDAPSAASQIAGLGAVLLQLGYSRDLEREADHYAQQRLTELGQDKRKLGSALAKLIAAEPEEHSLGIPALLSSHPDSAERIRELSR